MEKKNKSANNKLIGGKGGQRTAVGSSGMADGNKVVQWCAGRRQVPHMRSALASRFR